MCALWEFEPTLYAGLNSLTPILLFVRTKYIHWPHAPLPRSLADWSKAEAMPVVLQGKSMYSVQLNFDARTFSDVLTKDIICANAQHQCMEV